MASHAMLWSFSKWVWIGAAITVAAGPLSSLTRDCVSDGSYVSIKLLNCMDTVKPCCQPAVLQDGHIRHYERICFIFGQGLCQPLYSIPHVNLYVDLVRKLNSTNYMQLRRVYRKMVDNCTTAELMDSRLLFRKTIPIVTTFHVTTSP
ncbi:Cys3 [Hyposoter didymator ichnovirus]|nr:Cys3 [Hyposoter didymator ichnovirus]